jgi:flagellar motor protein MotB
VQRPSGIGDAAGIADNLDLSSRRAANVVAYFSAHGVDPNLLSAKGFGAPDRAQRYAAGPRTESSIEIILEGLGA